MLNPVIPLEEYVSFLAIQQQNIAQELTKLATPEEMKRKTAEVFAGGKSKGEGALVFKELLDNIKTEAYYQGQMQLIAAFLDMAKQQLEAYKAKTDGNV